MSLKHAEPFAIDTSIKARLMSLYTRTGDLGKTDLPGSGRVPKDSPQLEVFGALDELNAVIGLVRCESLPEGVDTILERVQRQLFSVADGAAAAQDDRRPGAIGARDVAVLEQAIDRYEAMLAPLLGFVLPGGSRPAALLHVARTVCRRAERRLVALAEQRPGLGSAANMAYINRLSDLLYVLSRLSNAAAGVSETFR